ncbi:MAG: TolC family protein, partial [Candidatus Omnitrophota bacterium]
MTISHCFSILPAFAAETLTLSEAYDLALKRSEDLAMRAELIHEAEAHFYQSLDVFLPSVHFVMTRSEQDAPKDVPGFGGENVTRDSLRRTTPLKRFTFSQPLFSGFKEFAVLRGSSAEKSQRRFELQRAEELLLIDVVEAFYTVTISRNDAHILEEIRKALEERVRELTERAKIGRSRESEVQTALADLRMTEMELERARRTETTSRQLLEFYIGREIQTELSDDSPVEELRDVAHYLPGSVVRSDVKAAEEGTVLAANNVIAAQSGFFPKVSLEGNYYTERVGSQSGIDWDFVLVVDIPIFDGAQTLGDVKLAEARDETARLNFRKAGRLAELEIRNAYEDYRSAKVEEAKLFQAAEASRKSYELQAEEYRMNLVNNLEVLDALRQYESTHRSYN